MGKQNKRLAPSVATVRRLLIRSGNECAFPGCTDVLFNDDDVLVAQCCHIEAANEKGQRYNSNQTPDQRRAYDNLLFMCHKHHRETDNVSIYDVAAIKKIKQDHEALYSEKPFVVNARKLAQARAGFEELLSVVNETAEGVKRIEKKLLEVLKENVGSKKALSVSIEYFGPPPILLFKGRVREIGALRYAYADHNTFLVGGISGVGKSTLTSQFLVQQSSYQLCWIDCETVNTPDLFYDLIARFVYQAYNDQTILQILNSPDSSAILRTVLQALRGKTCCLIFDGLNDLEDVFVPLLKAFNQHFDSAKVFITSKFDIATSLWKNSVYRLSLTGLDFENFQMLYDTFQIANITHVHCERLHHLLSGHPFLLKLSVGILRDQPVDIFISSLEGQRPNEIIDYVRRQTLENLNHEELSLLEKLSLFNAPFRYSIGNYIVSENYHALFKSLRDNYLIENFQEPFFVLPEFIRSAVVIQQLSFHEKPYFNYVQYLESLSDQSVLFEKNALVCHAAEAGMIELAKETATSFLSTLMGEGKFSLVNKIAADYESNPVMKDWYFIYYVRGRVARFQSNFEEALLMYNKGLALGSDIPNFKVLLFEKASILTLLSSKNNNPQLLKEAETIYNELLLNDDWNLVVQSEMSLATIKLRTKNHKGVADKLNILINNPETEKLPVNVRAALCQTLGDVYHQEKKYKEAFLAYDSSIDFYRLAMEKFGMNVIDGLVHLYDSYGWNYVKTGDFQSAVEMFACRLELCNSFDLGLKKERAMFDYGYYLLMNEEYEDAAMILTEHYEFVKENDLLDTIDQSLTLGALAFSHWYSHDYLNAVELIALLIISIASTGGRPPVSVIERINMVEEFDTLKYFHQRAYMFIIPEGKTLADFNEWCNAVISAKPHLEEVLKSFSIFKKRS